MEAWEVSKVKERVLRSMLDFLLLRLINEGEAHGYQLINAIREGYHVYFGASTVYPTLNQMEKGGYIESRWLLDTDRPRKVYHITSKGKDLLNAVSVEVGVIVQPLCEAV